MMLGSPYKPYTLLEPRMQWTFNYQRGEGAPRILAYEETIVLDRNQV